MSQLTIRFLNVGQGDATHIEFPNGQHLLCDCNRDRKNAGIDVEKFLEDHLPAASGKQKLNILVNTHPHDDHLRGMGHLHEVFEIGELWHSGHELDVEAGENPEYDSFKEMVDDLGDAAKVVKAASDPWATVGDATIHAYRPSSYVKSSADLSAEERREAIHDECVVLKIIFAGRTVILTGDSSRSAWESIVKYYADDDQLAADVLAASHHGSRTFFKKDKDGEAYREHIDHIDPDVVVVSVGEDNPHDHPHDDAIEEYERNASTIYKTDEDLTVVLTIDVSGEMRWETADADFQKKYELAEDDDRSDGSSSRSSPGYTRRTAATVIGGGRYA